MTEITVAFGGREIVVQLGENSRAALDAAAQASAALAQIKAVKPVRIVADYGVRGAIPLSERFAGMLVWVESDQRWFDLPAGDLTNTGWKTPSWVVPLQQGTLAERNNRVGIGSDAVKEGTRFLQTDVFPHVLWEFRYAGSPSGDDPTSAPLEADDWVEIIQAAQVFAETFKARVEGFRARALSTGSNIAALLTWEGHGDKFEISWSNYTIALGGQAREFDTTATNWADLTQLLATSDSMLAGKWVEGAAATLDLELTNVSQYQSGGKQTLRLGVRPLRFTVTDDTIPASGTGVLVTSINGVAPGPSVSYEPFAPEGFLNTVAGDTIVEHCSEAGWYGGRHGVVSVPNAGTPTYTFVPDDGMGASTVDPQSLFVPDNLAKLKTHEIIIRLSQNYAFTGPGNPVFPHDINPRVFDDIGLIVDATAGNPVSILGLTPPIENDFKVGQPFYTAIRYLNDQFRALWPSQAAYIPGIGNNMDYIRTNGSVASGAPGYADDQADIAAGLLPRSCMETTASGQVHMNAKGQGLEREFWFLWRIYRVKPPAVSDNTNFIIKATSASTRDGTVTTAEAAATISMGVAAGVYGAVEALQAQVDEFTPTYVQDTTPTVTSAALWFKTTPGSTIATLWIKGAS